MTLPPTPDHSPLAADDPRISEWLDGRLAPADAADIERAVQASPELVALVDDLRAIRGAMRELPQAATSTTLCDAVMAAISESRHESSTAVVPTPGVAVAPGAVGNSGLTPAARQDSRKVLADGRHLPWIALVGALAAGVLVSVVVNLPGENGREVALAPAPVPAARMEAVGKKVADREAAFDDKLEQRSLAATTGRVGDEKAAFAKDELAAAAPKGESQSSVEGERGGGFAGGRSEFSAAQKSGETKVLEAPAEALAMSRDSADFADTPLARGNRFRAKESAVEPQDALAAAGAPAPGAPAPSSAPVAAETAEPPFIPPVPATVAPGRQVAAAEEGKLGRADADTPALDALAGETLRTGARRRAAVPVAVVVITVGRPSERRALDQLVADSGLEVTREADSLELVGKDTAIEGFLVELEKTGLVPPGTAPRKQKADKQEGRDGRSLVLRIVERKAKAAAPAAGPAKP